MDPSSLIHDSAFAGSGVPAGQPGFNLAEVWQLPVGGGAAGILGARFGRDLWFPENPASAGGGNGNRDLSLEESSVTENSGRSGGGGGGGQRQRESSVPAAEATSRGNENDGSGKRLKLSGSGDENGEFKSRVEESVGNGMKPVEQNAPPAELPKQDYIHVRARRGQATDSHSLAERARREKISERMKILQDLVPGCNKVIGKALVLDEIINYIQSLQRQVEFLSMKLEAVNSRISPGIEAFPTKDFGILAFDTSGMTFGSQAHREYGQGSQPEWLHMQLGGGFERAT